MNMINEVIKVAAANGLWALLFVVLLFYQLQDSKKRETKYQETIESLARNLDILEDVRKDVVEIKEMSARQERKLRARKDAI